MRANWKGRSVLENGNTFFPLWPPRIQVRSLPISRCVFPLLFRRQPVGNGVAFRPPCSKCGRICERYIHDRPSLLSERRFLIDPMSRSRVISLSHEVEVLCVANLCSIHLKLLHCHGMSGSFLW